MPETDEHAPQVGSDWVATGRNGRTEAAGVEDASVILPPDLRDIILTPEAAEAIRAILDDQKRALHEGREMPTAAASVLLPHSH